MCLWSSLCLTKDFYLIASPPLSGWVKTQVGIDNSWSLMHWSPGAAAPSRPLVLQQWGHVILHINTSTLTLLNAFTVFFPFLIEGEDDTWSWGISRKLGYNSIQNEVIHNYTTWELFLCRSALSFFPNTTFSGLFFEFLVLCIFPLHIKHVKITNAIKCRLCQNVLMNPLTTSSNINK